MARTPTRAIPPPSRRCADRCVASVGNGKTAVAAPKTLHADARARGEAQYLQLRRQFKRPGLAAKLASPRCAPASSRRTRRWSSAPPGSVAAAKLRGALLALSFSACSPRAATRTALRPTTRRGCADEDARGVGAGGRGGERRRRSTRGAGGGDDDDEAAALAAPAEGRAAGAADKSRDMALRRPPRLLPANAASAADDVEMLEDAELRAYWRDLKLAKEERLDLPPKSTDVPDTRSRACADAI